MPMLINILDVCTEPEILKVILYIQIILKYVFFIVPIGLILMMGFDFFKNVTAGREEEMKKNLSLAIKRLILCVCMFFVPTIVSLVVDVVNDSIEDINIDYQSCLDNTKYIDYYEKIADEEKAKEEEDLNKKIEEQKKKKQEEEKIMITYSKSDTDNAGGTGSNNGNLTLDWSDVTKISNVSAANLKRALETSNKYYGKEARFAPYATTYVTLERQNSVNVFLLLGIHALESSWMGSTVTKQCNNLAGVKFAHQNGAHSCAISSEGDRYAGWNSINSFLSYYVPWLKSNYLTVGGSYYKGKTPEAIVVSYCPGCSTWPSNVKSIGTGLYNQVKDLS